MNKRIIEIAKRLVKASKISSEDYDNEEIKDMLKEIIEEARK